MRRTLGYLFFLVISLLLWKCASQTTPTGGPKDVDPPILLKSTPTNKQTNFKGKQVELIFDEALKLNNAKEEIIINPDPGKDILFTVKQNKVHIISKIGWRDSTTYSISFRDGIQDLNEGNPAEDLHLAFSTGQTIDSLQIEGKITQSLTEKIPEKITVALYKADTFNIFLHAPLFFTKVTKEGTFKFENLQAGIYHIYAFDDKNKNLKVESKMEKFGYIVKPIELEKNLDSLSLDIYQIDSRVLKINNIRNTGTITKVTFNKPIVAYTIEKPNLSKLLHSFGDNQEEINIYNQLELNDSLKLRIQATDSLELKVDSSFYIKRIETKLPKEKFKSSIIFSSLNPETFELKVKLQLSKPIQNINYDSTYISPDPIAERKPKELAKEKKKEEEKMDIPLINKEEKKDTLVVRKIKLTSKNISIDSIRKILTINATVDKTIVDKMSEPLNIVFEPSFLISIENDSSKREVKAIPILKEESTGTLQIEIITSHKNYEIQLLSTNGSIVQKVRNVKNHTFKYLPAQEYKIMIYVDSNNNGSWDAQNIYKHTVPEPVFFYKNEEGKYSFAIRSGWELGPFTLKF